MKIKQRTALGTAAALLLTALAVLLWPTGAAAPSDSTGPAAQDARAAVTDKLSPETPLSSSLITPATPQWWQMATSLAPQLKMWELEAPEGAQWYAQTTQAADQPLADDLRSYGAIYVDFDTAGQAEAFAQAAGIGQRQILLRDTLVIATPYWVNPNAEKFKAATAAVRGAVQAPQVGAWRMDLSQSASLATRDTDRLKAAYAKVLGALGVPKTGGVWEATSKTPAGEWTAKISNFQAGRVSVTDAGMAANTSATVNCEYDTCIELDPGLSRLTDAVELNSKGGYSWGSPQRDIGTVPQALGSILWGAVSPSLWEAAAASTFAKNDPPLRAVSVQLAGDGTLSLTPVFTR